MIPTRKIGTLEVFPIGLGAMPLSIDGRPEEKDALAVIDAALDGGVTLVDTADVYCLDDNDLGHNERLIALALGRRKDPSDVVVATKGGLRRPGGDWVADGSPKRLRWACEQSLKNLRRDSIALYQLHAPDERVPFEDSVGELARLKSEGKIEQVGLSNVSVGQLRTALAITPIASVQNRCNILDQRDLKNGMIRFCESQGLAFLPYSPVGGHFSHKTLESVPPLREIAQRHGATVYQIALAWLLGLSPIVIPIPGASRTASIRSSIEAARIVLEPEEQARLGAA